MTVYILLENLVNQLLYFCMFMTNMHVKDCLKVVVYFNIAQTEYIACMLKSMQWIYVSITTSTL